MFNKLLKASALSAVVLVPILAAGCTSQGSSEPYAVTGNVNQDEVRERARWTDEKGHYRPEWRAGINRPAGYPKNIAQ
jgi:hypothetical protein